MDTGIIVAVIAAVTSLAGAMASIVFSLRREHAGDWRKVKFEHYREFMSALSGITGSDATPEGHQRFALSSNTIQLIAPKAVIDALHRFRDEIAISNVANRMPELEERLLSDLIRQIRVDLGMPRRLNPSDLMIRFWVSGTNDGL